MEYPTQTEFAAGMSDALASAKTIAAGKLHPPVRDTVTAMSALFKQATGKNVGQFAAEQGAKLLSQLANELVSGTLDMTSEISSQAAELAGQLGSVVPFLAQTVVGFINTAQQIEAAHRAELAQRNQAAAQAWIDQYHQDIPKPTGVGGKVTPADMLRGVYEWIGGGRTARPLHPAVLFACLAGPEATGWPWRAWVEHSFTKSTSVKGGHENIRTIAGPGRSGYQQFVAEVRRRTGVETLGLSQEVQRQIWDLCVGIMGSVRPYTIDEGVEPVGEQGYSLFPVLCDLVLKEYREGHWNLDFIRYTQQSQLGGYQIADRAGGQMLTVIDFAPAFYDIIAQWKYTIEAASASDYRGEATAAAKLRPKMARVALSRRALRSAVQHPSSGGGGAVVALAGLGLLWALL